MITGHVLILSVYNRFWSFWDHWRDLSISQWLLLGCWRSCCYLSNWWWRTYWNWVSKP